MKLKSILALVLSFSIVGASAQDTLSVLFLGNSYCSVNNLPQLVQNLSASAGKTLIIDSNMPGGFTLTGHSSDPNSIAKISQGNWDYVILQEQSQIPTIDQFRYNDMYPAMADLKTMVEQYSPCAKIITYMTWGRRFGGQQCDPSNTYCSPVFSDFNQMQDSLSSAYWQISESLNIQCAPVGESWRAILSDTNLVLHSADNSHPNIDGSYVAALTLFSSIWKQPSLGLTYNAGISAGRAQYYQQMSDNVLFNSTNDWNLFINSPVADFSRVANGNTVNFSNLSFSNTNSILTYEWDFGDGNFSVDENPQHNYASSGQYDVRLIASNCIFSDTIMISVQIGATGTNTASENSIHVFPNPVKDKLFITDAAALSGTHFELYDLLGKCVKSGAIRAENFSLDLNDLASGIYILNFSGNRNLSFKVIKE
jgi:hypothetical protein